MVFVRYVVTAPFRALYFLICLPFLLIAWVLSLVKRAALAIISVPVYYLGRVRDRAAVAWEWTKQSGRSRLALPWWGHTCVKATQSTQTLEDDEDDNHQYYTPLPLSRPSSGRSSSSQCHPLLNQELFTKLQRMIKKPSTTHAQQEFIAMCLSLYLQQLSPTSSPIDSEREDEQQTDFTALTSTELVKDENSLRLILDLMSLSNSAGEGGDKNVEARQLKAREIASMYQYDSEKLQELIAQLDRMSFETGSHKKTKKGKESLRHSHLWHRHTRASPPRHSRSKRSSHRLPPPPPVSDSESLSDDACVTAEDGFSEEEPHTSEYHSPPEEISASEEEEHGERGRVKGTGGRGRVKESLSTGVRDEKARGRGKGNPKIQRPPASVNVSKTTPITTAGDQVEERQRSGSERHRSFSGGILSPVQESPEYALTPSTAGSASVSADELEQDLNKALSQLDSEASSLHADAKEVEYIEQTAARISETGSSKSESPSPFPTSAPTTPNTVYWEKGGSVPVALPELKSESKKGEQGASEKKMENDNETVTKEVDLGWTSGDFSTIPKVAPSLGLKEGHDRQQLAIARSSKHRRPPTRHTHNTQNESTSVADLMAADPEMERIERQLQQSVDTLSTLLGEPVSGRGSIKDKVNDERRTEVVEEDSLSEREENQSEEDFLDRKPPSITDQMCLLSPGSQQQTFSRDISPESALEDSLNLESKPVPRTGTRTPPSTEMKPGSTPITTSLSDAMTPRSVSSTKSSPGPASVEMRLPRQRSHSCDSRRHGSTPPAVVKPLMIPSSVPPWLEMRKVQPLPLQPLPPKPPVHAFTPMQPFLPGRSRASSDPPAMDSVYDALAKKQQHFEPRDDDDTSAVDEDQIYDCLEPATQHQKPASQDDDRIYELTPIRYLHQTVMTNVSPSVASHKPLQPRQDDDIRRDEGKSRSSSEKTRSSRERGREREREREQEKKERGRDRDSDKERRHRSHSSERDSHHSRHRDRDRDGHSSEKRHHHSSSHDHDRHSSRSKDTTSSSRKHNASSKSSSSPHSSKDSATHISSKRASSREKEKEKSKGFRFSFRSKNESSQSKSDSTKSSKGEREREKSSRSSGRRLRHREDEEREDGLHRTPSRFSIVSTSAISSKKESHPDLVKKTTSLSSLSVSGSSSQGSPVLSHDNHDKLI